MASVWNLRIEKKKENKSHGPEEEEGGKKKHFRVSEHPAHRILLLGCEGPYQQMINLQRIRRKSPKRAFPEAEPQRRAEEVPVAASLGWSDMAVGEALM